MKLLRNVPDRQFGGGGVATALRMSMRDRWKERQVRRVCIRLQAQRENIAGTRQRHLPLPALSVRRRKIFQTSHLTLTRTTTTARTASSTPSRRVRR